jgi:hypothetical protein
MSPGRWFVTLRVEATADPPTIEGMPMTAGGQPLRSSPTTAGVRRAYDGRASTRDEQIAAFALTEWAHRAVWPRPLAVGRRVGRAGLVAPAGSAASI